jgi:hypothetical protein
VGSIPAAVAGAVGLCGRGDCWLVAAGCNPVSPGRRRFDSFLPHHANEAHEDEHLLAMQEVGGSRPLIRSTPPKLNWQSTDPVRRRCPVRDRRVAPRAAS